MLPAHSRTGSKIIDCQAPLIHRVSSSLCGWSPSRVPLMRRLVSRVRSVVCYSHCDNSRYIRVNVRFPREKLLTMTSASCATRGTVSLFFLQKNLDKALRVFVELWPDCKCAPWITILWLAACILQWESRWAIHWSYVIMTSRWEDKYYLLSHGIVNLIYVRAGIR